MPLVVWNESFSIGVAVFDEEHQKLMDLVNAIYDGVQMGKDRVFLGEMLDALAEKTQEHFAHEEEMFQKIGYLDAKAHHEEHEQLYEQICDIQARYRAGGRGVLTMETMIFLKNWLLNHILDADRKFMDPMHEAGIF